MKQNNKNISIPGQDANRPDPLSDTETMRDLTRLMNETRPDVTQAAPPSPQPDANNGRSLAQIVIILMVLLVLVNLPFTANGFGLAHLQPKKTPLVVVDGLLVKGSGPEMYVMEDHRLRRIHSPEQSSRYFRLHEVRTVEDSFLEKFGQGPPIYHFVRCGNNSHVYVLESEKMLKKRRVKAALPNEPKPWDQIHSVPCDYLHTLPTGSPIEEVDLLPPS